MNKRNDDRLITNVNITTNNRNDDKLKTIMDRTHLVNVCFLDFQWIPLCRCRLGKFHADILQPGLKFKM